MAKKKSKGDSPFTYFRQLFKAHPEWLDQKSNDIVIAKYKEDHKMGEEEQVEKHIKNALANTKSQMRKANRDGKNGAPRKGLNSSAKPTTSKAPGTLETLELQIDESLTLARSVDPDGLTPVIKALLRARRELVWQMGQPS